MASDERLIFPLFLAQQRLRTHVQKALHERGIRVTMVQAGILFLLEEKDDRSMTDLSHALGTDNSTLSGLVDRMEKAGFVRRIPSTRDRRRWQVRITDQGRQEASLARPVIRGINREIQARLGREEMDVFLRMLHDLIDRYGPTGDPGVTEPKLNPTVRRQG